MAAKAARMRPSLLVLLICLLGWSLVLKIGSIFVLKKLYPESNGNYSERYGMLLTD
ncbi:hypothetical protein PHLCEN_2v4286 [Hermanssonia centrifuga]|uniref:Uncharacterized protein n=1 Tax=Hermanssonia centrifuga TaxID=98765 RepID=A0A2R6PVL5_9APHY|nr:hypothetical protein PHLCEN_2v4286 [Hermanssonia centrifuga]